MWLFNGATRCRPGYDDLAEAHHVYVGTVAKWRHLSKARPGMGFGGGRYNIPKTMCNNNKLS